MRLESEKMNNIETEQLYLTARFTSAINYARNIHIERRKGTDVPYLAHLLGLPPWSWVRLGTYDSLSQKTW
jgi:hypothetical protein